MGSSPGGCIEIILNFLRSLKHICVHKIIQLYNIKSGVPLKRSKTIILTSCYNVRVRLLVFDREEVALYLILRSGLVVKRFHCSKGDFKRLLVCQCNSQVTRAWSMY